MKRSLADGLRARAVVDGQPALELGSLGDIRSATKGGMDPSGAAAANRHAAIMPGGEPGSAVTFTLWDTPRGLRSQS